jgi:hypothetical protein
MDRWSGLGWLVLWRLVKFLPRAADLGDNSSMETEGLLGLIYKSIISDWQVGLAHLVVEQLFKTYSQDDRISRVELQSMLNAVSMRYSEDPIILFEQVSATQNLYGTVTHQIDEE